MLDYEYAARWQLRAALSRDRSDMYLEGTKAPVVIVPGVYEPWRFMTPLVESIHASGHPVHVLDPLGFNHRPVPEVGAQVERYLNAHDLKNVLLVTHSKGGLVGKYVMSGDEAGDRVAAMLAIATPFSGSKYARSMRMRSLRIFAPDDTTIITLAGQLPVNSRIVSVYSKFDPHIPEGSALPGARNVELPGGRHFRILERPEVVREFTMMARTYS
ncbi:Putative hydrolase/acyltransferase [Gulosibacter molinativorax]|nr:Putative hydrolase/acyltransferase [Gulosibacter molinativorax]